MFKHIRHTQYFGFPITTEHLRCKFERKELKNVTALLGSVTLVDSECLYLAMELNLRMVTHIRHCPLKINDILKWPPTYLPLIFLKFHIRSLSVHGAIVFNNFSHSSGFYMHLSDDSWCLIYWIYLFAKWIFSFLKYLFNSFMQFSFLLIFTTLF